MPGSTPDPSALGSFASPGDDVAALRSLSAAASYGLYLGEGDGGPAFAAPQHGLLVLGPPRSGKTTTIVVPNVLAAAGPVVSTSTKPDVLLATSPSRSQVGSCFLFDPSGTVKAPPGVRNIGWSPLVGAHTFQDASMVARAMVDAARPGATREEATHWSERAGSLLSVFFYAGAVGGIAFADVVGAVDTREPAGIRAVLAREGARRPSEILAGILDTDSREQSGIWSTAASILSCYRSEASLETARGELLDAKRFVAGRDTLYVCAPGDQQKLVAPVISALLQDLKAAAYEASAERSPLGIAGDVPMLFALDEVANIAPLNELPGIVTQGGSQGVVVLACFQDLSQAAGRWPEEWKGFLSTFGAKLVFPGIADTDTLERISNVLGEHDEVFRSETRPTKLQAFFFRAQVSRTSSTRRVRRYPVGQLANGFGESTVLLLEGVEPSVVSTRRWQPALERESLAYRERALNARVRDRTIFPGRESDRSAG